VSPNKEMKLTSVERIGRSQLISSVLLLLGWTTKGKPSRVWTRRAGSDRVHRLRRPPTSRRLSPATWTRRALVPGWFLSAWSRGRSSLSLGSDAWRSCQGHGTRRLVIVCGRRRSHAGLAGSVMRAVPHPPGSRRRAPWRESGVRSGRVRDPVPTTWERTAE
jgi:hypothetical protein